MDAFFESPKHGSNSNGSNQNQSQLNESLVSENSNNLKQEANVGTLSGGDNSNSNQVVVNQPMDQTNSAMQFTEGTNDNSMAINQMTNNLMLSENNDLGSIQNSR